MHLAAIYRHPVKSLGCEALDTVTLDAGAALPGDRDFAVAHGQSAFDPQSPRWERCGNFVRIANVPALARPAVSYDPSSRVLTLTDGAMRETYDLGSVAGRETLAAWVGEAAGSLRPGPYAIAEAPGISMTDAPEQAPSLMSLASLRDLSERVGVSLDPRRFRGNLWIDGEDLEPWAELGWSGRAVSVGAARLSIVAPIVRCLATAADPETGARRDNPLPALKTLREDPIFGMIAPVAQGGSIAVGDAVTLV